MGRRRDLERRAALLAAVADQLERRGLAGASLRPLSKAVGVSPRTLLYHFGSKEEMLREALDASRARSDAVHEFTADRTRSLLDRLLRLWERTAAADADAFLRLWFEAIALALREPEAHADLLAAATGSWVDLLRDELAATGLDRDDATVTATCLVALHHGLTLDLLATSDAARTTRAYHHGTRALLDSSPDGRD